jgi:hypothetical protein
MTGRGVPQPSVGSSEASLPGLSPTASTTRVRLRPASVDISSASGSMPTRPRSRRSASQQQPILGLVVVSPRS